MADAIMQVERAGHSLLDKQAVYEKHALPPHTKTIRVLDVRPIPRDAPKGTPVECTLRIINLDLNPAFTALSYVWGDPTPTRPIICDGVIFGVGENCYSALWHLSKKLGGLIIWVDAICIDQEDNRKEKAWQIPLMGDIYTKARQVYVWLGEADERSDRAMQYLAQGGLRDYVKVMPEGQPRRHPWVAGLHLALSPWSFTYHPRPFRGNKKPLLTWFTRRVQYVSVTDLAHIFDRPWKARLWTYQEILLASYPVIVCGVKHVKWSDLEWTLALLGSSDEYFPSAAIAWEGIVFDRARLQSTSSTAESSVLHNLHNHHTIVKRIHTAQRWSMIVLSGLMLTCAITSLAIGVVSFCSQHYPGSGVRFYVGYTTQTLFITAGPLGLFACLCFIYTGVHSTFQPNRGDIKQLASDDLVGALYQRQATDPKDMAYGMWAILRKRGVNDLSVPRYDIVMETQTSLLYRQLTAHLIQKTGNLRCLHISAARRLPGTPSWVPDWSSFKSNTWREVPGFPGSNLQGKASSQELEDMFSKHRAHEVVSIDSTQSVLTVLAKETGVICGCISFCPTTATALETDEKRAHLDNLRSMLRWADWAQAIGCKIWAISYTKPFHELLPISAAATWPSPKERTNWGKVLSGSRRDSLEANLTLWMNGNKVPRWFRKFMATQICLCNLIAELKRSICYVSISARPGTFCVLACSDKTRVDDRVLTVYGLLGSIVVRKRNELDNAVEIISPTFEQGAAAIGKVGITNLFGDIAIENVFAEYQFH